MFVSANPSFMVCPVLLLLNVMANISVWLWSVGNKIKDAEDTIKFICVYSSYIKLVNTK